MRKQSLRHKKLQQKLHTQMAATVEVGEFVDLKDIPILETGVEYPASTGSFTVSSEMIQEVLQSQLDPHIPPPRIKIAHADNAVDSDLQSLFEQVNADRDASQPALGTIQNMRAVNNGQTLIGDFYGLPEWLAAILETAYPARSIEGGAWKNEANGKEYAFMVEAVSLLGVVWPGCTSLADLQELFSKDGPKVQVIEMKRPKMEGGSNVPRIALQVNVEDIRRTFYEEFAQGDRYWWWDRELLIDPNEMIVEDPEEGQLYRLAFDLEGETVTFKDPKPVKIKYVPDTAKKADDKVVAERLLAPQLEGAGRVLAINHTPPRESERQNREESPEMAIDIKVLRDRLGLTAEQLPDDATEEQINTALTETAPAGIDQPSTNVAPEAPEPGTDASGAITKPDADVDRGSISPNAETNGLVGIPKETLAELQRQAALGATAHAATVKKDRDDFIAASVRAGKIPPAAGPAYRAQLELGGQVEESTRAFLNSAPAVLPVGEVGSEGDPNAGAADQAQYIDTHLTPEERMKVAAARGEAELPRMRLITEA
jgi:hypothetical protein